MKYIRTKDDKIYLLHEYLFTKDVWWFETKEEVLQISCIPSDLGKIADTIEELCDEFVSITEDFTPEILVPKYISPKDTLTNAWKNSFEDEMCYENVIIYGAIWTDKGLIYVAKMNDKGELELL